MPESVIIRDQALLICRTASEMGIRANPCFESSIHFDWIFVQLDGKKIRMPGTSWGLYIRMCKLFLHDFQLLSLSWKDPGYKDLLFCYPHGCIIQFICMSFVFKVEGSGFVRQLWFVSTWMIGMRVATTLRSSTFKYSDLAQWRRFQVVLLDGRMGFGSTRQIEFQFGIAVGCSQVFPVSENRAKIVIDQRRIRVSR